MKTTHALAAPAAFAILLTAGICRPSAAAGPNVAAPQAAPGAVVHGTWSLMHDGTPPPPPPPPPGTARPAARTLHTIVYDPAGDRVLLFGGLNGIQAFDDTWSQAPSGEWTQLAPIGMPPSQRRDQTAIYDPVRNRMIVFGGSAFFNSFMNDTYALSLTGTPAWSPVSAAGTLPPGRFAHTAIYDPVRDRMIVFGGYNGAFRNDVWQLTLSGTPTWSQILPGGGITPAGRNAMTAVYDPVRDRMLIFGGWTGIDFKADVWALNLSGSPVWTQVLTSGTAPIPRRHHAVVYDPVRDRLVISGGESWLGNHNDTHALSLAGTPSWSAISPTGQPPSARAAHRAVFDPVRDRMVVFGGYDVNYRNDTHVLSLAPPSAWSELTLPPPPPPPPLFTPRRDHIAIYDPVRDRMIIHGGWNGSFRTDVWTLSLAGTPAWSPIVPQGTPPPARFAHTGFYDDVNDRLVVFGGYDGTFRNDVWALSLSGTPTWSQILPSGPGPDGRNALTAVVDPVRDRAVFFGGWDGGAFREDLWALNLSGPPAWTALSPSGGGPTPVARRHHGPIYDPLRDELVMFAGLALGGYTNDTWMLALANHAWSRLGGPSRQAPSPRDAHRVAHDSQRDRMLVFAGYDGQYLQDVWELSLGPPRRWSNLSPGGTPPAGRVLHTAIYDPIRERLIVHGGEGQGNELFGDTWALDFSSDTASSVARGSGELVARSTGTAEFALRGIHPNPWGGAGDLTVSFSLPGNAPASLEVFTVAGQRVLLREVGSLGGGAHRVSLDLGSKAPGLYMVRLSSRAGSHVTKVVKLH